MDAQVQRATEAAADAQRRLVTAIRRSAATHDRAADLLERYGRHERATFHREGAVMDRVWADELAWRIEGVQLK
jgi:hypothetical protein